ncbi:MAG: glycogen synthase GlgA [Acidobacteriota bacterium]
MEPLKICFVSSEVAPFAKTGGLADVAGALPPELARQGHDVRIVMPLYSKIDFEAMDVTAVSFIQHVPVDFGPHRFHFTAFTTQLPDSEVDVYFIGCPQLYDREGIYTGEWDEHLRYAMLCRGAIECCQRMGWGPDVFHCNDWHTALIPLYLRTLYSWDRLFEHTKTVLTIHNIAYQGWFPSEVVGNLGLSPYSWLLHQEDLQRGVVNYLKTGILYADVVTTVSRTYAKEIQTEAFGNGLQHVLRQRGGSVMGIVNGIDDGVWNPEIDPALHRNYGVDDVAEGKAANKAYLLEQMGLPYDPAAPVFGVVSRLTPQKGFEITQEAMIEALRYLNIRFVVLGSGEPGLEGHFTWLQNTFPNKVCYYRGYHEKLAHQIEAGADIFVMPSRFEPCGLNQMYSLRYGTVPIVRKTGGLADTVSLYDPRSGEGTGVVFDHYDDAGFAWGLKTALRWYQDPETWARVRRNGMLQDHSWGRQAGEYVGLYRRLTS